MIIIPKKKWTFETINIFLKDKNIELLTKDFKNVNDKAQFKDNNCGHIYNRKINKVISNQTCPLCAIEKNKKRLGEYSKKNGSPRKLNTKIFKEKVAELYDDEYTVLGEYINSKTGILIKHNICGYEWEVLPCHFTGKAKSQCPKCQIKTRAAKHSKAMKGNIPHNKRTHEQYINELQKIYGNEYTLLDKYINEKTKIRFMHNPCGKIFTASPEKILNMITTCPYCNTNISNGAAYVRTILEHLNLPYGLEFTFEDLKSDKGKYLRFDFNIIVNNKLALIEVDGLQHEKAVDFYGGDEYFNEIQKNDKRKNEYCLNNNIPLLRIKYKDITDAKKIITNFINYIL